MYDLILIGYGIAHMSLLLALSARTTSLNVCIIDPYFDGGDLVHEWASVRSNTTWQQFLDAVQPYCSGSRFKALAAAHVPEDTIQLGRLAQAYKSVVDASVEFPVNRIFGRATKAVYRDGAWHVTVGSTKTVQARRISCAPGADPRALSYPVPELSLHCVLRPGLENIVKRGEKVVVFGLSHSGTLAIDALLKCGALVVGIYNTEHPFMYARDGIYGGIKQESAKIADRLVAEGTVPLIKLEDASVLHHLMEADWVVYAVGFVPRSIPLMVDSETVSATYDTTTGIGSCPASHFWGIAYPNSTVVDGQTYYDVSLAAFLAHCEKNIDSVLSH